MLMIFQGKDPSLNFLLRVFSVSDTRQTAIFKHIDSVYQLRYSLNRLRLAKSKHQSSVAWGKKSIIN